MKKSQVAMETILIYGLAILVVTSGVGYLAYSDKLNAASFLPNRCDVRSVDLSCSEYAVIMSEEEEKSGIKIEFQNNLKFDVEINKLIIKGKADMMGMWSSDIKKCELKKKKKIYHETKELIVIDNCDIKLPIGNKIKGIMNISYNQVNSKVIRTTFGEISANVMQGCFGIEQEFCNNKDDNCNGLIDENLEKECSTTNQFGTCTGVEVCDKGLWSTCDARTPALEECNGIDDDCNGKIDDGLEECCECLVENKCQAGKIGFVCNGCHYVEAPNEICDGIDNNCDGEIDEGFIGSDCKEKCDYAWTNYTGSLSCCGDDPLEADPYEETELTCNDGNDNDCDGTFDNNQGIDSDTDCCMYIGAETCSNGIDEDCNGQTDENCPIDTTKTSVSSTAIPSPDYPDSGNELINGKIASNDPNDPEWVGYTDSTFDIILDLGSVSTIDSASAHFLSNTDNGIYLPQSVTIYTSENGIDFVEVGTFTIPSNTADPTTFFLETTFPAIETQYIKFSITANPSGQLTLLDEVMAASTVGCECSNTLCKDTTNYPGFECNGCDYVVAPDEICDDLIDNDCDNLIDEGCCECTSGVCCDGCNYKSSGTSCGTKDCDVNNYYYKSGSDSPTGTNYCKLRDYADCTKTCTATGTCQDCSCTSYSDSTQATAGVCKYISGCSSSTAGTVRNYAYGTSCGASMICDNGNCISACECSGTSCNPANNGQKCDGCHWISAASTEICNDGIDNDCDGKTDYSDSECKKSNGESCSSSNECQSNYCIPDTKICSSCSGYLRYGYCWYYAGSAGRSCNDVCSSHGGCPPPVRQVAPGIYNWVNSGDQVYLCNKLNDLPSVSGISDGAMSTPYYDANRNRCAYSTVTTTSCSKRDVGGRIRICPCRN